MHTHCNIAADLCYLPPAQQWGLGGVFPVLCTRCIPHSWPEFSIFPCSLQMSNPDDSSPERSKHEPIAWKPPPAPARSAGASPLCSAPPLPDASDDGEPQPAKRPTRRFTAAMRRQQPIQQQPRLFPQRSPRQPPPKQRRLSTQQAPGQPASGQPRVPRPLTLTHSGHDRWDSCLDDLKRGLDRSTMAIRRAGPLVWPANSGAGAVPSSDERADMAEEVQKWKDSIKFADLKRSFETARIMTVADRADPAVLSMAFDAYHLLKLIETDDRRLQNLCNALTDAPLATSTRQQYTETLVPPAYSYLAKFPAQPDLMDSEGMTEREGHIIQQRDKARAEARQHKADLGKVKKDLAVMAAEKAQAEELHIEAEARASECDRYRNSLARAEAEIERLRGLLARSHLTPAGYPTGWAQPSREPAVAQPQDEVTRLKQALADAEWRASAKGYPPAPWEAAQDAHSLPPHLQPQQPPASYQSTINCLPPPPPIQSVSSYGPRPVEYNKGYTYRPAY